MSLARKIAVNASALAIGRLASAGMGVAALAITSRYLGVRGFGALATGLAFVGIVGTLTDIGISTVGAREIARRPDERETILNTVFTVGLVLSVAALVAGLGLMLILYPSGERHLERDAIFLLMLLPPPPLGAAAGAVGAYFVAEQKAYIGAIAAIVGSALNIAVLAAVVLLDWGFEAVVVA